MSARASKFIPLKRVPGRPVWIRVVGGESRLGMRRVALAPAQIFTDVPPRFLRPRALALMKGDAQWLTYLSLARPLVLGRQPNAVTRSSRVSRRGASRAR